MSDFLSAASKNYEIMLFSRISATIMKGIVQEIENFVSKYTSASDKCLNQTNKLENFKFDGFMASESFIRAPSGHFIENF